MQKGLVAGLLLAIAASASVGVAAWTAHEMRQSVLEWGKGFVDRPVVLKPDDSPLQRRLDFAVTEAGVSTPSTIAPALNDQLQWWLARADVSVALGPARHDGARTFRLAGVCLNPKHSHKSEHRNRVHRTAHPVECPDPAADRLCYHVGRKRRGRFEAHLALTVELVDDQPHMHISALYLVEDEAVFRVADGPLADLDGLAMDEALAVLRSKLVRDAPKGAVDRWAIEGYASLKGRVSTAFDARLRPRHHETFIEQWRAKNLPD